jgi:hypothetical protein
MIMAALRFRNFRNAHALWAQKWASKSSLPLTFTCLPIPQPPGKSKELEFLLPKAGHGGVPPSLLTSDRILQGRPLH